MATPTPPRCPRCAAPRGEDDSCPRCGIVYARYRPPGRRPPPPPPRRWPRLGLFALVLVVGVGIGWALRPVPPASDAAPGAAVPAQRSAGTQAAPPPPAAADSATPVVPALAQDPLQVAHISAQGVATLTVPPTHMTVEREPDGLRMHAIGRHPVETIRLVLRTEAVASRSRLTLLAQEAIAEVDGVLGPPGTVRRGVQNGLDATFDGQWLGAPLQGRVQVLPLGPDATAVVFGWGPGPAAAHSNELRAVFQSLTWTPNLDREVETGPRCTPPDPGSAPVPVNAAGIVQRVQALQGCVVVLELWAADCTVCRAPHAETQLRVRAMRDEGLAMVQVALDEHEAQLLRHLRRARMASPPLVLERGSHGQMPATLARLGVDWPGTRPWFAVFDRSGALIDQGAAPPSEELLRRAL